jgi:hypothetical protein
LGCVRRAVATLAAAGASLARAAAALPGWTTASRRTALCLTTRAWPRHTGAGCHVRWQQRPQQRMRGAAAAVCARPACCRVLPPSTRARARACCRANSHHRRNDKARNLLLLLRHSQLFEVFVRERLEMCASVQGGPAFSGEGVCVCWGGGGACAAAGD